jgi:hypothetical protein
METAWRVIECQGKLVFMQEDETAAAGKASFP